MPVDFWSPVPLFTFVAGLAGLVAAGISWMLAARRLNTTRNATERCLQMLTRRLLMIESRINELENQNQRAQNTPALKKRIVGQAFQPDSEPCQAGKPDLPPGRRSQALLDVRNDQDARDQPTLIAIPDLGAGEKVSDGGAGGDELGERHGEAWTLAAAGVAPEEIARQTGQPIGQVELIVGLYRRLHSSRGSIDHARSH